MIHVGFVYNFDDTNEQLIQQLNADKNITVHPILADKPTVKQITETIPAGSIIIWRILPENTHSQHSPVAELETQGYVVINSHNAATTADDKLTTHDILTQHKIPTIPTWECAAGATIPKNHIVKPRRGLKGKHVLYGENTIETINEPVKTKALAAEVNSWIMQPYIPSSEKWLRVLVINGETVAAYRRVPVTGRNIANVNQGATREQVEITPSIKKLAEKTAKTLNLTFTGLDITHHPHIIVEANSIPAVPEFAVKLTVQHLTKLIKTLHKQKVKNLEHQQG